jgi:hypothetical protein
MARRRLRFRRGRTIYTSVCKIVYERQVRAVNLGIYRNITDIGSVYLVNAGVSRSYVSGGMPSRDDELVFFFFFFFSNFGV